MAGVNPTARKAVSVLIPARNEEHGIAECVESVLESSHVELEVIVLDDHSTDRTADIVRSIAARDARLRLEPAPPLPDGWCGKPAACFALSRLAKFTVLLSGRAGVGGPYDWWRRFRSWLRGERFDPSHDRPARGNRP